MFGMVLAVTNRSLGHVHLCAVANRTVTVRITWDAKIVLCELNQSQFQITFLVEALRSLRKGSEFGQVGPATAKPGSIIRGQRLDSDKNLAFWRLAIHSRGWRGGGKSLESSKS
jgi:hypothetical protein